MVFCSWFNLLNAKTAVSVTVRPFLKQKTAVGWCTYGRFPKSIYL
ncbi:MAG: hypothetical protein R3E31_09885 [Chloroflexota bacterium]